MSLLSQSFELLGTLGFFDVVLPFLLFFSISYGTLIKSNMFSKKPAINTLIALVIGLIATTSLNAVAFTKEFLPIVSVVLLIGVVLLMIPSLMGTDSNSKLFKYVKYMGVLVGIGAVIYFIISYYFPSDIVNSNMYLSQEEVATLIGVFIVIAMIILPIWYISKENKFGGNNES